MKRKTLLHIAFLALLGSSQAAISLDTKDQGTAVPAKVEGPMKEALDAFNEGRHIKAIDIARPLAEKGNADALFLMGFAYESGRGVDASREKAIESYQKASTAGQKDATYRLALILLSSKEKAEREQGKKNLEEAAKKDPANAGRILGEAYIKGMIDEKTNVDEAINWWTVASEAGDIPSIMGLARIYEAKKEFPDKADPKKALAFYQKAITLGDKSAMVAAGSRLLNGDESIRNEAEGRELLAKAIEEKQFDAYLALGDFEESIKKDVKAALAQYELGGANQQVDCAMRAADFYFEGKGDTEKNAVKGIDWLRKAAETKNPVAGYRYAAKLLEAPEPDERKPEEKVDAARRAYDYLLNAALGGIAQAQNEMALFYLSGAMGVADPSAAAGWFQRAAQSGNAVAMNNLATLYEKGYGVVQNFSQAGQLYEASARRGNAQGAVSVARLLASGAGTKQNIPQAWAWANIAIQNGDKDAKSILGEISTLASTKDIEEGKKALETLRAELAKAAAENPPESETPAAPVKQKDPTTSSTKESTKAPAAAVEQKDTTTSPTKGSTTATTPPVSATTPPVKAPTPPVKATPNKKP
jgi:TPR repeat protein